MQREKDDFNERFNKSLCVEECDDEVEVPKEKLDFIPKLALALHLLEQSLGVLFDQNMSISHEIGVDTINKAVTLNRHFQKVKDDFEDVSTIRLFRHYLVFSVDE